MRRLHHDEGGAVLALYAIAFVAILGMLALTLDLGRAVAVKRDMVNGADAAALGAAQECATQRNVTSAQAVATDLTVRNRDGATVTSFSAPDCEASTLSDIRAVSVGTQVGVDYFVAPIVGFDDVTVAADATAVYGPVAGAQAVPISVNYTSLLDCGILPYDPDKDPSGCDLEYPKDSLKEPRWGVLDLSEWGDRDAAPCFVSANEAMDIIAGGGYFPEVWLAETGPPNWDCVDNGLSDSVWEELEGRTLIFPVIDVYGDYPEEGEGIPSEGETQPGSEDCTAAPSDPLSAECQIDTMNVIMWIQLTVPPGGVTKHGPDVFLRVEWDGGTVTTSGLPGKAPDTGVYAVRLVD